MAVRARAYAESAGCPPAISDTERAALARMPLYDRLDVYFAGDVAAGKRPNFIELPPSLEVIACKVRLCVDGRGALAQPALTARATAALLRHRLQAPGGRRCCVRCGCLPTAGGGGGGGGGSGDGEDHATVSRCGRDADRAAGDLHRRRLPAQHSRLGRALSRRRGVQTLAGAPLVVRIHDDLDALAGQQHVERLWLVRRRGAPAHQSAPAWARARRRRRRRAHPQSGSSAGRASRWPWDRRAGPQPAARFPSTCGRSSGRGWSSW